MLERTPLCHGGRTKTLHCYAPGCPSTVTIPIIGRETDGKTAAELRAAGWIANEAGHWCSRACARGIQSETRS